MLTSEWKVVLSSSKDNPNESAADRTRAWHNRVNLSMFAMELNARVDDFVSANMGVLYDLRGEIKRITNEMLKEVGATVFEK